MTTAAKKFLDAVAISWDSREPWENTARLGLAEVDADALREMCGDEDYTTAEAEVLVAVCEKVAH